MSECRIFSRSLFTSMLVMFAAAAPALAESEIKPEDLPATFNDHKILQGDKSSYVLTGISRRNMQTGEMSFLALSPVNPVPAAKDSRVNRIYGLTDTRPMTWAEAAASCRSYDNLGKSWRLPTLTEIKHLNFYTDFGDLILAKKEAGPEIESINRNWHAVPVFFEQYNFFWIDDPKTATEAGLKLAGTFGKEGRSQKMTDVSLLSYFCVTHLKGQEREVDRLAAAQSSEDAKKTSGKAKF